MRLATLGLPAAHRHAAQAAPERGAHVRPFLEGGSSASMKLRACAPRRLPRGNGSVRASAMPRGRSKRCQAESHRRAKGKGPRRPPVLTPARGLLRSFPHMSLVAAVLGASWQAVCSGVGGPRQPACPGARRCSASPGRRPRGRPRARRSRAACPRPLRAAPPGECRWCRRGGRRPRGGSGARARTRPGSRGSGP